jgi:PAS domain S-box-containing protein
MNKPYLIDFILISFIVALALAIFFLCRWRGCEKRHTERFKIEKELRKANDQFHQTAAKIYADKIWTQMVLDTMPIGVITYDHTGNITYVNRTAQDMTGYTQVEIMMLTNHDEDDLDEEYIFWNMLKAGQTFFGYERFCPTKDGRLIPVMMSSQYIYDEHGENKGTISTFTDMTEQYRLQKAEQHAKVVLDHISEGVITVNNDGIINGFNSGAEQMTGYKTEDVMGKSYDEIFIKGRTMFTKLTLTLNTNKEYKDYKRKIETEYGIVFMLVSTKILRDGDGRKIGAMAIYKDITKIERLEEQIRQSDKLAVVGELAAGTAHEIRNPLTSIRGFVQLLLNDFPEGAHQRQYIELILSEITRINNIIKEMLLLAKPSDPKLEKVDFSRITNETISLIGAEAVMHGVEIKTFYEEIIPNLFIDPSQIKQVLINIMRNAIQAMPQGGILEVHLKKVNGSIEIDIVDSGIGIPKDYLERIFDPFFTTKADGTGLGLPVSYRIMQNHDGQMKIYSESNKGTTVKLCFPIRLK